MSQTTQPSGDRRGIPVRTVRARVLAGPEEGAEASAETLAVGSPEGSDLVLRHETVSRFHVELRGEGDGIAVVDHGSTNGTRYVGARMERGVVPPGARLSLGEVMLEVWDGEGSTAELHETEALGGILGRTPIMRRLTARVRRAARTASTTGSLWSFSRSPRSGSGPGTPRCSSRTFSVRWGRPHPATGHPPDAMSALVTHHWPGNVRELRNAVEASLTMGEAVEVNELALGAEGPASWLELGYEEARAAVLGNFERPFLRHILAQAGGNVSAAARRARMDRTYHLKLLQRHGLR